VNIDEMEAGQEMDIAVAVHVMGLPEPKVSPINFRLIHHFIEETYPGSGKYKENKDKQQSLKNYSTDIAAAWGVVEKMQDYQKPPQISHPLHLKYRWWVNKWWACIGLSEALAETASLAICRAALKAMTKDQTL